VKFFKSGCCGPLGRYSLI